jgi:hypothetical protein
MIEKSNVEKTGSKNQKIPENRTDPTNPPVKRGRGRPKGSKNKPKALLDQPKDKPVKVGKKRGRKKDEQRSVKSGKRAKKLSARPSSKEEKPKIPTKTEEELLHEQLMQHPLFVAAKWLEKKMHPTEMQYYKRTANQRHTTVQHAMVSDMLGLFNNQDHDFCKLVRKNKFVVNNTTLNEIHK